LTCYPNPANNMLFIASDYPVKQLEIINTLGACILSSNNEQSVDISNIPIGMYVIKIYVGTRVFIKKIIKN